MYKVNAAKELLDRILGPGGKDFKDYKAPHAYRPTPPRRRFLQKTFKPFRLFKGYRP